MEACMAHSTKTISDDLRKREVEAIVDGASVASVAVRFAVSKDSVRRWTKRYVEAGSVTGVQRGGYRPAKISDMAKFEAFARAHAHCTLRQMQEKWEGEVSEMCLSRALTRLGWTHKKNSSLNRRMR
jgi:transposase